MIKTKKKFISIIWGYHKQIFTFEIEQNYHMMPLQVMKDEGYDCEIYAIDSQVKIEEDPNFVKGVKVIYYKNIFTYLYYLFSNRIHIIYSNSLTIKTLVVGMIGKKTIFYPHSYPFGHSVLKNIIIKLFYNFFKKIRVNNPDELKGINSIKNNLGHICPLAVSANFLDNNKENRSGGIWIGNITNIKNPEFLLNTCEILKNRNIIFCISILGEDRYLKDGKSFFELIKERELENYIKILGFIPHKESKIYLKSSLLYINTSISEGQCLAVYEGALAGNILCLQNIIAFPSVFKENAYYHNNPKDLVNNIITILENKKKSDLIIKNNQKMIINKYNYKRIKRGLKNTLMVL